MSRRVARDPLSALQPTHALPLPTPSGGSDASPYRSRRDTRERPSVPIAPNPVSDPSDSVRRDGAALTRRALRAQERVPRRRSLSRPVLAGGLTVGLALGAVAYASAFNLGGSEAAFVVGTGVSAQTDELARARTVDTTYRAAASVSRNERRTAITVAGARTAVELEAKAKAEALRKAREAEIAEAKAEAARMRKQAIANARENPQAAARVLMVDHGWTSDAQYNCLVNLWNGESGWNYLAENRGSGAYGIPQSLPGSKMSKFGDDWRTNPITQIKWGLWYIDSVYGSPCNAWSTWQSRSPHWY